jgi:hypothetical protein
MYKCGGVLFLKSFGGRRGSFLLEKFDFDCENNLSSNFCVTATQAFLAFVKPYNFTLVTQAMIDHLNFPLMVDNEAIYNHFRRILDP